MVRWQFYMKYSGYTTTKAQMLAQSSNVPF